MATDSTSTDMAPDSEITITEIWPSRFELTIDSDCGEIPVATTYTIDRAHLQTLRRQIDEALC